MKRNESILVYGVTGLLALILVVAVVFGNEGAEPARRDGGEAAPAGADRAADLARALNLDPAAGLEPPEDAVPEPGTDGGPAAEPDVADAAAEPAAGAEVADADADAGSAEDAEAGPLAPWTPSPPRDFEVVDVGNGQRYRRVTVRSGDTFSTLVQRWCGSLEHMPLAEALNEELDTRRLPVGARILLPWVPDEELAAARRERTVESAREAAASSQFYEVQENDSLWRIAVDATGDVAAAPRYVERILELNPGLVPERLRVGQEIVLPQ